MFRKVVLSKDVLMKKANAAFSAYDGNKDGVISKGEMARISGGKLTREQIEKCFESFDTDGDGYLSKKEFANMMVKRGGEKSRSKKS